MTATPSERVEQARKAVIDFTECAHWDGEVVGECNLCGPIVDTLIAAVRAERDAEILRVVERMKAVYPPSLQREATLDAILTIISDPEE